MQGRTYYDRAELKKQARSAMSKQRGTSILLPLLPTIIALVVSLANFLQSGIWGETAWQPSVSALLVNLFLALVILPITVGVEGCFVKVFKEEATGIRESFSIAFDGFFRKLGAMMLMGIYIYLWTLLLFIPGIMKTYSYAMVPYILAEYPGISANKAIRLSSTMMRGHRFDYFVLELSFIGWHLLGALTLSIASFLFSIPYMYTAQAGFYTKVRDIALENGTVKEYDFM